MADETTPKTDLEKTELSQELDAQGAEELPDREAMSPDQREHRRARQRRRRGQRPVGQLGRLRERRAGRHDRSGQLTDLTSHTKG